MSHTIAETKQFNRPINMNMRSCNLSHLQSVVEMAAVIAIKENRKVQIVVTNRGFIIIKERNFTPPQHTYFETDGHSVTMYEYQLSESPNHA